MLLYSIIIYILGIVSNKYVGVCSIFVFCFNLIYIIEYFVYVLI